MRRTIICLTALLAIMLTVTIFAPPSASLFTGKRATAPMPFQSSSLKIIDVKSKKPPVINENKQATIAVVNSSGQPVTDVTFESGSPDIARVVDPVKGIIQGVTQGYATITATRADGTQTQEFAVITRVNSGRADKLTGRSSPDSNKFLYFSDPVNHLILKSDTSKTRAPLERFAGTGARGIKDGNSLRDAQFSGPLGIAVDNRSVGGGIYIADTLNNSIRRIENGNVTTVLGSSSGVKGVPARLLSSDTASFSRADDIQLDSPQGIAIDSSGKLYVCDTNNNAIYVVNFATQQIRLLAGAPGQPGGLQNGRGRDVRFRQPNSISLTNDRVLQVTDTGNSLLRQLDTQTGEILGYGISTRLTDEFGNDSLQGPITGIPFNNPTSVSSDSAGNIYVIDSNGAQIVTFPANQPPLVLPLAQPEESITMATNITVRGTQAFVVDAGTNNTDETLKSVSVGAPEISSVSPSRSPIEGGTVVTITGKNFAPDSALFLGDSQITAFSIINATSITFTVPAQKLPGRRTLSVQTRGGIAQMAFGIIAKPLAELRAEEITTVAGGAIFSGDGGKAINASLINPASLAFDSAGNLYFADTGQQRVRRIDVNTGIITTVAGTGTIGNATNGPALAANFNDVVGIQIDKEGNLIVCDQSNHVVRKIDLTTSTITTIAGIPGSRGSSGDGGLATSANLNRPRDVAIDSKNNIYIVDTQNNVVRKIDAVTKMISRYAGTGSPGFNGDDIPATQASLQFVFANQVANVQGAIAFDKFDNLYIADVNNQRIRRVDTQGMITTVAGSGTIGNGDGGDSGLATNFNLRFPDGILVDADGNLIILDKGASRVRKVDLRTGMLTTIAGTGKEGFSGDNGMAINATFTFANVAGIAVDGAGNLVISDSFNNKIRRVDLLTGIINSMAGDDEAAIIGDNGPATNARLVLPGGISIDQNNNLIIADTFSSRIRRIAGSTGIISTIAGNGRPGFNTDNIPAVMASLGLVGTLRVNAVSDNSGNIFIADFLNHRIRRVSSSGNITTVAGTGNRGNKGDDGPANLAEIDRPLSVAVNSTGDLFFVDANNRVRKVSNGTITAVAGTGMAGSTGDSGPALVATFNAPQSIAIFSNQLYIADTFNHTVRRLDLNSGRIALVAGSPGNLGFSGDGGPATAARLNTPRGVTVDRSGNIYIADSENRAVRRVDAQTGVITTVFGGKSAGFSGDGGLAVNAQVNNPVSVATDQAGNLFIADVNNNAIRAVKAPIVGSLLSDFQLTITPGSQTFAPGAATSFTIQPQISTTLSSPINLSATVMPSNSGLSFSFAPPAITGSANSSLTINAAASVPEGSYTVTITGTSGQLVRTVTATIIVSGPVPPTIMPIGNQTVKPGDVFILPVLASDKNGNNGLRLSLVSAPRYVTLTDNGNGEGRLQIAPTAADSQSGRVTIMATDPSGLSAQTSFDITLVVPLMITNASYSKPNLSITGTGFGQSGASVRVNGTVVDSFISSQSDTQISIVGKKKALGIKKGANQVTVTVNGTTSNTFVFQFFAPSAIE